jgi:threonine/homoserine efflux transporter RhtA
VLVLGETISPVLVLAIAMVITASVGTTLSAREQPVPQELD